MTFTRARRRNLQHSLRNEEMKWLIGERQNTDNWGSEIECHHLLDIGLSLA